MMRMSRFISVFCLAILFLGLQESSVYAQHPQAPENSVNAINYRYQIFDDKPVVFADSVKFRDRFYNIFSGSVNADWESSFDLGTPKTGIGSRLTFGYRLSPVHAIESDLIWNNIGTRNNLGLDVNWVMNLNNYAKRRDGHNRFEALFIAGASYRQADKASVGLNTGMRLQWNPGINAGIFVEPKINVMTNPHSSRSFSTMPSISFGLTLRYHQPKYYLWDYLTPFAIKTNLLYDAASVVNVGIEAPIKDRWSVAFEWVCPWWSDYDHQKYLQLLYGSLEGRYWFGDRDHKPQLTGWFAGLSVGGGLYDLMAEPLKGIQGEFQTVSAIAGFAHPINRKGDLRLEYSLGIGWMGTEYVKYWWDDYDYTLIAPSPQTWITNWFGPTKVQVSLVYMLKLRSKVGGRP